MRVRMTQRFRGYDIGEVVDLGDEAAAAWVEEQVAEYADRRRAEPAETTTVEPAERAVQPAPRMRRGAPNTT